MMESWVKEELHRVMDSLPPGWAKVEERDDGALFRAGMSSSIIVSGSVESDRLRWLHASIARPASMPTYADMVFLHKHGIGSDRKAFQVFAPSSEHVNIHPYCLHLWHCLDGDALPDFTHGSGSI